MKAITLHQPWADLIARGIKTIETRSWPTQFRGLLAIHAGKKSCSLLAVGCQLSAGSGTSSLSGQRPAANSQQPSAPEIWHDSLRPRAEYGAVVAVARMYDCRLLTSADEPAACCECAGRYGFFLRDIMPLRHPMKLRGQQGLWEINEQGTEYLMRLYSAFMEELLAARS